MRGFIEQRRSASEEREILERLAERLRLHIRFAGPEVLYEWSLILRVLYLTHMDEEYYQVLGLLKDYLDGKLDFTSLIKKLKEIEDSYEQQFQQILKEKKEELPPITLQSEELLF
jgi:hypothetical protein